MNIREEVHIRKSEFNVLHPAYPYVGFDGISYVEVGAVAG
jgi:hypothetical protein